MPTDNPMRLWGTRTDIGILLGPVAIPAEKETRESSDRRGCLIMDPSRLQGEVSSPDEI